MAIQTRVVRARDPRSLHQALIVLRKGGLVAFPTDTVYGLGALALDGKAVESIYAAKGRPSEKAIPVLLGDVDDLDQVAEYIPGTALKLAARFWPGPLTLVIPKKSTVPPAVSATDTVGVRVPDHAVARALLRAAGPMAVSSANLSDQPSPSTAKEVLAQLDGRVHLILDGGKTPGGVPSTVVDCTTVEPVILRAGPLSLEKLKSAL